MFRRLLLLLFTAGICFFVSAMALAEDGSHAEEELTIEQAIAVALKNNPSIRVANEARIAGRARIGQTQSAYYPYVNLQTRYSRSWQEASQSSARNHYGNTFELSQLIFDFGRTPGLVGSARESYESLKESYQNSRQIVALNTKVAYYAYLAYERELMLTEEIVRQRNQLLHQAKQFFKTGLKPRIDVTRAEANLYDAKLSFIKAQNGLQIAKINLVNALGIEKLPWSVLKDVLEIKKPIIMNLDDAKSMAIMQRPDLLQNKALEREREFSVKAAKAEYLPRLSGNANYGWSSTDFPLQEEWTVGMQMAFPLFTGFEKREKLRQEEAKLRQAKAFSDVIIQNTLAEVEQAYADMNTASEQIVAARKGSQASNENLELATKRYQQGLNDIIEITDAQVQYLTAETKYINSLYDYKIAEAMLEKATGKSY